MNILELLSSNSYLTVNKALARKVGLEAAALFADLAGSQLYWNNQKELEYSEWFFRTREQIEEQTTLSAKVQLRCIKILVDAGLVQTKLKGLPAVTHYLIAQQEVTNLFNLISQKGLPSYSQTAQLDTTKGSTIKNINNKNINNDNININKENSFVEKKSKNKDVEIYPANFTDKMIKASNDFFEYRKQIGKSFKAEKSIQTKLNQWSQQIDAYGEIAVIQSIETAIANQYQGTFIDKQYLSNTQKPLIDDKGNYANTDAGRELFISNIRKRAEETFRK